MRPTVCHTLAWLARVSFVAATLSAACVGTTGPANVEADQESPTYDGIDDDDAESERDSQSDVADIEQTDTAAPDDRDAPPKADALVKTDARPQPRDAGPRVPPPPRPSGNNIYSPEGELPWLPAPNPGPLPALVAGYGARRVSSLDGEAWGNDVAAIDKGYDDWDNLRCSSGGGGYIVAAGGGPRHDIIDGKDDFGRGYWRVLVSADGIDWVDMRGPGAWFGGIAYGNGLWVAGGGVGWWGHSKDLVHWVENPKHPTYNSAYRDLAFGNGMFIAVGGGNRMMSRDGKTWNQRSAGSSQAIAYGGGKFVAVGSDGCAVTSDGVTWREQTCGGEARDVAYGNGIWVATSRDRLVTSTDAITWTPAPNQVILRIGFGQGVFVGGTPGGIIKTSADGRTWKVVYRKTTPNDWNTVATVSNEP